MAKAFTWVIISYALFLAPYFAIAQGSLQWTPKAGDLDLARIRTTPAALISPELLLVRTHLKAYRVRVIRALEFGSKKASAKSLCHSAQAALCINANFFDESDEPLGLVLSRGIQHHAVHKGGSTLTGIFAVTRRSAQISSRDNFDPRRVVEAIQAGPRLMSAGTLIAGLKASGASRRSGVCLDGENNLIFFVVSSGIWGISIDRLQELLRDQVHCRDALNLDGGGSSQLFIRAGLPGSAPGDQEMWIEGADQVPVVLALLPQ
jgi:uncharacterized protein YigE (DUF2233 family)